MLNQHAHNARAVTTTASALESASAAEKFSHFRWKNFPLFYAMPYVCERVLHTNAFHGRKKKIFCASCVDVIVWCGFVLLKRAKLKYIYTQIYQNLQHAKWVYGLFLFGVYAHINAEMNRNIRIENSNTSTKWHTKRAIFSY